MSHHQYPTELHTVCDVVRWAMSEMERFDVTLGHGTADYWEEATFLVLRTLKLPFDRLEAFWNAHLTQDELWEVLKNIESRVHNKVPAPYLVHEAWLTEHPFYVDERVLIPRSYIAELLEEGLEPWVEPENIHTVLDMCTGSGCLAILAQMAFPEAQVTGADISADALEVAKINRTKYGLDDDLELVQTDIFSHLGKRKFDLIISNPPYVTHQAMEELPAEYRHEPALALEAGDDGMDFMRRFMPALKEHLTENGVAIVEIGDGRESFEAIWPELPVTWLSTEEEEDMVFAVRAEDLQHL